MSNRSGRHSYLSRRKFLTASGGIGAVSVAGCLGGDGDNSNNDTESGGTTEYDDINMILATEQTESHPITQGAYFFKEELEAEVPNASVEVAPGAEYGDQTEIVEFTREGAIQASGIGLGPFDQYAPGYFFIQTPFVPRDYEHILSIAESDLFQPAYDNIIAQGNQRLVGDMFYRGVRQTYTTDDWGPVQNVDDIQGLPIRITPWETWQRVWSEVGVDARAIAFDEIYTSVETGVIDGFEGPYAQTIASSQYEVADYVNHTENLTSVGGFYLNEEYFQGLNDDTQELVLDLFNQASQTVTEQQQQQEEEERAQLEEAGLTMVDDTDPASFQEAAAPAIDAMFEDRWVSNREEVMSL